MMTDARIWVTPEIKVFLDCLLKMETNLTKKKAYLLRNLGGKIRNLHRLWLATPGQFQYQP